MELTSSRLNLRIAQQRVVLGVLAGLPRVFFGFLWFSWGFLCPFFFPPPVNSP